MTNSVTSQTNGKNFGVFEVVEATVDITSLGAAGTESFDPNSSLSDVDDYEWVAVIDQEEYGYSITFDHTNDAFEVRYADYDAAADGVLIAVPSTTDVGTVTVLVFGRR